MKRGIAAIVVIALVAIAAVFLTLRNRSERDEKLSVAAEYVDAAECASCHAEVSATFHKTGMGRSFSGAVPENIKADFKNRNTFYHAASDRYYTMLEKDGRFFERRHQLGADGQPTNVVEKEIHYVLGSGNHASTFLHRNEQGKLIELPVAWYSEKGGYWAMNPGYDRRDHQDFRRTVTLECVFCHNAYPAVKDNSDRSGSEPSFTGALPEGIDCQRCHGPGGAHVRAARSTNADVDAIQKAIVNPALLPAERKLELCMQCHLESTSTRLPYSVRRFDRGVFSFRPGQALSDYAIHFDHAANTGHDDKFEIVNQAYRLLRSACFQKSAGALTCTTCHDPHDVPRGEDANAHYVGVCQKCHTQLDRSHTTSKDCLSCHMPKRRTDDVVHVVMTDHYIQRQKPSRDLLAPLAEKDDDYKGEVALLYPTTLSSRADSELYTAVAQVKQNANLQKGIARLEAAIEQHKPPQAEFYFELGEAYWESAKPEQAIPAYRQALARAPEFWPALHKLGLALSRTGPPELAISPIERASSLSSDATVFNDLALVYRQAGRMNEAVAAVEKAIILNPDLSQAHNNLGGLLRERGDTAGAERAFQKAVEAQPDLAAARINLGMILVAREDFRQARYHFEKAIANASPGDPSLLDAHNALADVMSMQGQLENAVTQYRAAIQLDPEFAPAHFSLGSILAMQGRKGEALSHFQKAAESRDPAIRQSALEALQKLKR